MNAKKLLALFAHPDDAELICGGTLLLLLSKGWKVKLVCVTLPDHMNSRQIRKREAEKAAQFLGAKLTFLSFKDGFVLEDGNLHKQIGEQIDEWQPELVFTHTYNNTLEHQDHCVIGRTVSIETRRRPFINCVLLGTATDYFSVTPNVSFDISNFVKKKEELLKIFVSQQDKWYVKESLNFSNLHKQINKSYLVEGKFTENFVLDFFNIPF